MNTDQTQQTQPNRSHHPHRGWLIAVIIVSIPILLSLWGNLTPAIIAASSSPLVSFERTGNGAMAITIYQNGWYWRTAELVPIGMAGKLSAKKLAIIRGDIPQALNVRTTTTSCDVLGEASISLTVFSGDKRNTLPDAYFCNLHIKTDQSVEDILNQIPGI